MCGICSSWVVNETLRNYFLSRGPSKHVLRKFLSLIRIVGLTHNTMYDHCFLKPVWFFAILLPRWRQTLRRWKAEPRSNRFTFRGSASINRLTHEEVGEFSNRCINTSPRICQCIHFSVNSLFENARAQRPVARGCFAAFASCFQYPPTRETRASYTWHERNMVQFFANN